MPCFFGALGTGEICGSLAGQVCEEETGRLCAGVGRGVSSCANRTSRLRRENSEESQAVTQDTQDASDAVLQCPSIELAFPDAMPA